MESLLFAPSVYRALVVCVLLLGLVFPGATVRSQASSILIDAGNGQTAELTDYSLTNYGEISSGFYQGDFCVTLRNTSSTTAPELPIYLTGVGMLFDNSMPGGPSAVAQSYPESFTDDIVPMVVGMEELLDWLIVARNSPGVLGSFEDLLNGPTDGLAYQSSGTFCFRVSKPQPFTDDVLLDQLVIIFSHEIAACYATATTTEGVRRYSSVHIDAFSESELSLRITNRDVMSIIPQRVVGAAFDVSEGMEQFQLAPDPTPVLKGLTFTNNRRKLARALKLDTPTFDFGLIRGRKGSKFKGPNGLGPYETASFAVQGNFEGVTTDSILRNALMRFVDDWATQSEGCGFVIPGGEGIRGAVATVPR